MMTLLTAGMALTFALIHVFIGRLGFLDALPRSRWLSFAGGVAVAYVFLHILPELAAHREDFATDLGMPPAMAEGLVYGMGLFGLALFYGLERLAKLNRDPESDVGEGRVGPRVETIHLASFSLYNLLIGYLLLHREDSGLGSLALYFLAMALHFITADFGMRQDCPSEYDRIGRWALAASALAGWLLGMLTGLPALAIGLLFAFLAGGVMLNVLKEELPEERKSRFFPFALGAVSFALLIVGEMALA